MHSVIIRTPGQKPYVVLRYSVENATLRAAQQIAITGEKPKVSGGNCGQNGAVLNFALRLSHQIDPLAL